jgi:Cu+-exporting ATPase
MKRDLMMLQNLNCPTCASQLEAAAIKLPGVAKAKVSYAAGTLDVQYDQAQLSQADIAKLLRRHGIVVATILPGGD